jgi:hypothetical protein
VPTSQRGLSSRDIGRIDQNGNANCLGHQVMQEPEPLVHNFRGKNIDARRVAAWPGEACNKTELHRVFADAEHDRDRRSRSFSRKRSKVAGKFHWLAGPRPADHGGLTELGL